MKTNDQAKEIKVSQLIAIEDEFSESSLPSTMQLADDNKNLIQPYLLLKNMKWSYHDKVLAWLFGTFSEDITRFYEASGPTMEGLIKPHALSRIDETAFLRLKAKIRGIKAAKTRAEKRRKLPSLEAILGYTVLPRKNR